MKMNPRKTFIGSLVAFFVGTSCCWISALTIWLSGATILTSVAAYLGKIQPLLIAFGLFLAVLSFVLMWKNRQVR